MYQASATNFRDTLIFVLAHAAAESSSGGLEFSRQSFKWQRIFSSSGSQKLHEKVVYSTI